MSKATPPKWVFPDWDPDWDYPQTNRIVGVKPGRDVEIVPSHLGIVLIESICSVPITELTLREGYLVVTAATRGPLHFSGRTRAFVLGPDLIPFWQTEIETGASVAVHATYRIELRISVSDLGTLMAEGARQRLVQVLDELR